MSRTSVKSRSASRFPTETTGSFIPASISATCRANDEATNEGACLGPIWLNGRNTTADRPCALA